MSDVRYTRTDVVLLLKQIVAVVNQNDANSRDLWDILTGLRGPDREKSHDIKGTTTARLRGQLGFEAMGYFDVNTEEAKELDIYRADEATVDIVGYHFTNHYNQALSALKYIGYKKDGE